MPKRSTSQHVCKDMQACFDEITQLTDAFCQAYLNDRYGQLCRELTATLCRKRPSPLVRGKAATWACGITHAASYGQLPFRFLADPSHCGQPDLGVFRAEFFPPCKPNPSKSAICWACIPWTRIGRPRDGGAESPHLDASLVNGLIIDVRHAPREIQEAAFHQGVIPYIPET